MPSSHHNTDKTGLFCVVAVVGGVNRAGDKSKTVVFNSPRRISRQDETVRGLSKVSVSGNLDSSPKIDSKIERLD